MPQLGYSIILPIPDKTKKPDAPLYRMILNSQLKLMSNISFLNGSVFILMKNSKDNTMTHQSVPLITITIVIPKTLINSKTTEPSPLKVEKSPTLVKTHKSLSKSQITKSEMLLNTVSDIGSDSNSDIQFTYQSILPETMT